MPKPKPLSEKQLAALRAIGAAPGGLIVGSGTSIRMSTAMSLAEARLIRFNPRESYVRWSTKPEVEKARITATGRALLARIDEDSAQSSGEVSTSPSGEE